MTNEDFKLLTEYKEQLQTALYSDYARYVPRKVLQRMADIVRGENANYRVNASCSRCALSILKDVARLYENEKQLHKISTDHERAKETTTAKDKQRRSARDAAQKR